MTILFDTAEDGGYNGVNVADRTWNHTVQDGDGMILWVGGSCFGGEVAVATYGGVPMTELSDLISGNCETNWFYLVTPPTGINAVVITFTANLGNVAWTSNSYSGVDPATPLGTLVETTNVLAAISVNVVSEAGELVVDCVGRRGVGDTCAEGAGQTERAEGTSGAGRATATSDEPGAALVTMSWTLTGGNDNTTLAAVAMRPWIKYLARSTEYTFDVWDPLQRIIGRDGHEVFPNEVRADKWGRLLGFRSPSSKVFATLADSPDAFYISGVTGDGESVRIIPDEKLFADMILKRLAR